MNLNDGEVSPASDRMAIVRADDPDTTGGVIYLYGVNAIVPRGQPGATPTPACAISGAGGAAVVYHRPTWAPDGLSLVWDEPGGLHAGQVPATALEANDTNCGEITEQLIVPGGAT
ncbi:MAG: hypothetical protein LC808_32210, partial [Actinobacteria bacterium]|nr:hypothetical protein [Actinomycetota bacterium]